VGNSAAAHSEVGDIRRRLGDLAGAAAAFAEADRLCPGARPGVALLRLAEGDVAAAASLVGEALEGAGWNRLGRAKVLPAVAQISVAAGDVATAEAAVVELEEIAGDFDSEGLQAAATTARGRVQLAAGAASEAATTLRAAVSRWTALGVPYELATARLLLGEACRATGDTAGATASFDAARALFDDLGVRAEAVPAVPPARPAPSVLPQGLTEREAEVLRLVAAGHTNKEVAATLFLSDKTVARHLSNIFTKIGVSTRAAATAFAFGHGLVGGSG
jgi:DNA-binding CsgD family transcriptional regulator